MCSCVISTLMPHIFTVSESVVIVDLLNFVVHKNSCIL